MKKIYITPTIAEIRLGAPTTLMTTSVTIDNDNYDDDPDSDRSKAFGGFAWDDTEE